MIRHFHRWLFALIFVGAALAPKAAKAQETSPQTTNEFIASGNKFSLLKRFDEAIEAYTKAMELSPDLALAYLMRGTVYLNRKEYLPAIVEFNRALALDKSEYLAVKRRGEARAGFGQQELATADELEWKKMLGAQPKLRTAQQLEDGGDYFRDRNQLGDAIYFYGEALKLESARDGILEKRGEVYASVSKWKDAIADYTQLIAKRPDQLHVYLRRAGFYAASMQINEAIKDFSEVITRAQGKDWSASLQRDAYQRRALMYEALRDRPREIADLSESLKLAPKNAEFRERRGKANLELKNYAAALADYDAATQLDSALKFSWKGEAHRVLNQPDLAIAAFTRAIEILPDYPYALSNRGQAYVQRGAVDKGIADYDAVIKIRT